MAETRDKTDKSEYVTFIVGGQMFCIAIMSLREIRGWSQATPLPDTPDYVLGVLNLRGSVLPIIDLAARFGLPHKDPDERSVIMVTNIDGKMTGLLADAVSDIIAINPDDIQPAPSCGTETGNGFVSGLLAREDEMISLVSLTDIVGAQGLIAA